VEALDQLADCFVKQLLSLDNFVASRRELLIE
jgi:hypothetical protein